MRRGRSCMGHSDDNEPGFHQTWPTQGRPLRMVRRCGLLPAVCWLLKSNRRRFPANDVVERIFRVLPSNRHKPLASIAAIPGRRCFCEVGGSREQSGSRLEPELRAVKHLHFTQSCRVSARRQSGSVRKQRFVLFKSQYHSSFSLSRSPHLSNSTPPPPRQAHPQRNLHPRQLHLPVLRP
jgi:hypothetical protein